MKKYINIILLIMSGWFIQSCSTVNYKVYNDEGQLIKEYDKTGAIPWSNNKVISPHFSGMGL